MNSPAIVMPFVYHLINCPLKAYSTEGCYSCWHCPGGRTGCDNLYWIKNDIKIEYIECQCNLRQAMEVEL